MGIFIDQADKNVYRQKDILLSVHIFDHLTAEMEPEIYLFVYQLRNQRVSYTGFPEILCMRSFIQLNNTQIAGIMSRLH